jgi:hypothetical protein
VPPDAISPSERHRDVDLREGRGVQVGDGGRQVNLYVGVRSPSAEEPRSGSKGRTTAVLVGRPPLQADSYQPRPVLREAIRAAWSSGSPAVVTQVMAGDGGTGKTQLAAAEFIQSLRESTGLAVWVSATTRQGVLAAYAEAYSATHPQRERGADHDAAEQAEALLRWLAVTDIPWIIVLDDVADPADLHGLWPTGPTGRVIITTRRRDAALTARGRVIEVGVFSPEESLTYLTDKLRAVPGLPTHVLDNAADLARDLGHLPLALTQASAVIIDDALTCDAYRAQFTDTTATLDDLFGDRAPEECERTIAGTWALAAEKADALPPQGLARPLLALASVLDPNGIPETVLCSPAARELLTRSVSRSLRPAQPRPPSSPPPPADTSRGVSPQDARRALRNLHRLSLLTHDPSGDPRGVRIHALAQRATIERLPRNELAAAIQTAADALMQTWPANESNPALHQALRANAMLLAERYAHELWLPQAHSVLYQPGHSLGRAGLVTAAAEYFSSLAAAGTRLVGHDHPDVLTARHYHADWHSETGDQTGAAQLFEQVLAARTDILGADAPETLHTRRGLACARAWSGDLAGGIAALEALLQDVIRVLGPDHRHTLSTRHELSRLHCEARDHARACRELRDLAADQERILGPDDLATLYTRHEYARALGEAGNPSAAVNAFESLLADETRLIGSTAPMTLWSRNALAFWRGEAGDAAGASNELEQLLLEQLQVLGPDHPDTLDTRHNIARWRADAGDPATALTALKELLTDQTRILGPHHLDTLNTRHALAYLTGMAGDLLTAVNELARLLADRRRILSPDHPTIDITAKDLAHWQHQATSHETSP